MGKCKFKKVDKRGIFWKRHFKNITLKVNTEISMLIFCYIQDFRALLCQNKNRAVPTLCSV